MNYQVKMGIQYKQLLLWISINNNVQSIILLNDGTTLTGRHPINQYPLCPALTSLAFGVYTSGISAASSRAHRNCRQTQKKCLWSCYAGIWVCVCECVCMSQMGFWLIGKLTERVGRTKQKTFWPDCCLEIPTIYCLCVAWSAVMYWTS